MMVGTILITRIFLFLVWDTGPMYYQIHDQWHHMYTALILICVSIFFSSSFMKIVQAVGIGLFLDEWIHIFHIILQIRHMDYWSWDFILVTFIGIILIGRYYYKVRLTCI